MARQDPQFPAILLAHRVTDPGDLDSLSQERSISEYTFPSKSDTNP